MSLVQLTPDQVADKFVDLCRRLREMGATRVDAFGLCATFGPPAQPLPEHVPVHREPQREPEEPLTTQEARDIQKRAQQLVNGVGR